MTYSSISTTVHSSAGIARAQYALLNSDGVPHGPTSVLTAGQDAGFGIYIAIKKAGGSLPPPRLVDATGDNGRFHHRYTFQPASIGELDMSFAAFNDAAAALFTGTKLDTSNAEWVMSGYETNQRANKNSVALIVNTDSQDANAGTDGQARFTNWIYPNVVVYPQLTQNEEANAAEWSWRGILTSVGQYPWGTDFSTAINGFTKATRIKINSVDPLTMHTFIGNAAASSFFLNYTPSSDQTGYAIKAWNASTGVPVTISSVDVGSKKVTLSAIPAANVPIVVLYEAFDLL